MFSNKKYKTSKRQKGKKMAKEKTANNEVGVIGQMYEERKTGKVGVLESREVKYKTLMMRDKDGKTFNITFSTFRSNWRKYQGEEVIQTSTQVEEQKVADEKKKISDKKTVKTESTEIKLTTEEKVKRLRALSDTVSSAIIDKGLELKVDRSAKGAINVRYKKTSVLQIWDVYKLGKYSFRTREMVDKYVKLNESKEVLGDGGNNIRYRVTYDKFDNTLAEMLNAIAKFIDERKSNEKTKKEKQEEK